MMRILSVQSVATLAVLGSFAVAPEILRADDAAPAGVIRISDRITPIPEPNTLPMPISSGRILSNSTGSYYSGWNGGCNAGCNGNCGSNGGYKGCGCCRLMSAMICPWGGCTHSPDHGWCRPQKVPVERIPVVYRRYWPSKWYGQAGYGASKGAPAYPMVYMPTDTTQLGFYYQRVPQWQPNPRMLPPVPCPSNWHIRCGQAGCNHCGNGVIIPGGTIITPTPTDSMKKNGVPPKPVDSNKSAAIPKRGSTRN